MRSTTLIRGWAKNNLFLSECRQISSKSDTFWHTNSQDNKIMWGALNVYLT